MEDGERKELVWKKSLHVGLLTAEELLQVVENITLVPDLDPSKESDSEVSQPIMSEDEVDVSVITIVIIIASHAYCSISTE